MNKKNQKKILSVIADGDDLETWRSQRRAAGRCLPHNRRRSVWNRAAVCGAIVDVLAVAVLLSAGAGVVLMIRWVF